MPCRRRVGLPIPLRLCRRTRRHHRVRAARVERPLIPVARILGIDYGERRIGVAVSDPLGISAQPLSTVARRRGKRPPYAELERIITEWEIGTLVVGLPLTPEGDESPWTGEVRAFGDRLAERTALPVHYVDERMTSARAERAMRAIGISRSQRQQKERIDAGAAILILQAHLDSLARSSAADER